MAHLTSRVNLIIKTSLVTSFILITSNIFSQDFIENATVQGNIYTEANYYFSDSLIDAERTPEYIGTNIYGNVFYRYKGFNAGIRYEAYQPPLLGHDPKYEGQGIAHRFINYSDSLYEITVGNFYEQFGSGIILRAYEDKNLGIDNAFDGFRLLLRPINGLTIKGMIGKQRFYWENGPGTVRGADIDWSVLQLFKPESLSTITIGVSGVSRFQSDRDPLYNFPENVAAFSARSSLYAAGFFLSGEYAWKINDPSAINNLIYKNGQALILNGSYSKKGFGILASAKYIDNMDFRSSRSAISNDLTLSYLPANTRQHTYSLPGMYPYATQPTGEAGAMVQVNYLIPKNSKLGGKYGTHLLLSGSIANSIYKEKINDTINIGTKGTLGYKSRFGKIGDQKYYHDISFELNRRITKDVKMVAGFANQFYNVEVIEGHSGEDAVHAWIVYADISYKFQNNRSIRFEGQHLSTQQDKGNWAMALAEFTIAPKWSFSLTDQYNYGNPDQKRRKHYFSTNMGYNLGAHRLSLSYGKQREGVICVGGICRNVPASYSVGFTFSTTF
jgi:hypothetical protein